MARGHQPEREGTRPPDPPDDPSVAEAVAEKLRVLSLLRALDRAGLDPDRVAALREPFDDLAEYDQSLTALLEILDRARPGTPPAPELDLLVAMGRGARRAVLDALDEAQRANTLRWIEEVPAHEREVWMQVEELRRRAPTKKKTEPGGPLGGAAVRTHAAGAFLDRAARADERVRRHEAKPVPARGSLRTWLKRVPVGWLRTIARMHGLDGERAEADLVAAVASHLRKPRALAAMVTDLLGPEERSWLVGLALTGDLPVSMMPPDMQKGVEVPWDWGSGPPPGVMARLRGVGVAFVGTRAGERVLAMPEELRRPVLDAIGRHHPEVLTAIDHASREWRAVESIGQPFDIAELARWKRADRDATAHIVEASQRAGTDAVLAFLGDHPRMLSDAEGAFLLDYMALTWRERPGAPTAIEHRLRDKTSIDADQRVVLDAVRACAPSLYQIVRVEPPRGAVLADLLRGGEPVFVDDRAVSVHAEPGHIVPGRVYPAGPFRFFRASGEMLPAEREADAVAWLEDRCRAYGARTGADRTRYLLEQPQDLWEVVTQFRAV